MLRIDDIRWALDDAQRHNYGPLVAIVKRLRDSFEDSKNKSSGVVNFAIFDEIRAVE